MELRNLCVSDSEKIVIKLTACQHARQVYALVHAGVYTRSVHFVLGKCGEKFSYAEGELCLFY